MTTYVNDPESAGELGRLDHQAGLVGSVTKLLPALLEDTIFPAILDVGCGPGRWTLDMAVHRPESQVLGIDISRSMVEYANARAWTQHLNNVSFEVKDFLSEELPFAEASFDLIHIRFATGWVKGLANWLLLLARCFVLLKPGGRVVLTEGEGIYTTSRALEGLQEILCGALFKTGYSLSSSPRYMGVVARLGSLLTQTGFHQIQTDVSVLDYSHYNPEANMAWLHSFQALLGEGRPFLLQSGVTTLMKLDALRIQISIDMYQANFCGIGPLFTFSAQKPEDEEKAES